VSEYVVEAYVRLRKQHKDKESQNKSHTYTSARTLLGVLRLSQALARLRFAPAVEEGDVDEALRLMEKSKESLEDDRDDGEREIDQSTATKIYRTIKDMATTLGGGRRRRTGRTGRRLGKGPGGENDMDLDSDDDDYDDDDMSELSLIDIRQRIQAAGFTETQLMDAIMEVRHIPFSSARHRTDNEPFSMKALMSGLGQRTVPNSALYSDFFCSFWSGPLFGVQVPRLLSYVCITAIIYPAI
jgi:DNA replication licensing factor MCM7